MDDAQTWTLIGGFLSILVAMSARTLLVVGTEIRPLDIRLDGIAHQVDHLDRDLQIVVTRLMDG